MQLAAMDSIGALGPCMLEMCATRMAPCSLAETMQATCSDTCLPICAQNCVSGPPLAPLCDSSVSSTRPCHVPVVDNPIFLKNKGPILKHSQIN